MSKEAMKLALEALEYIEHNYMSLPAPAEKAITALREALAEQPAQQEPVAMRMPKVGDEVICIEDDSLGTVAYLTAGGSPEIRFDDGSHGTYMLREFAELFRYTSPPAQRTWVGLTDEETGHWAADFLAGAKWAESKLKEKNT